MNLTTLKTKAFDFIGSLTKPDEIVFIHGLPYIKCHPLECVFIRDGSLKQYKHNYKRVDQNRFGVWIELEEYLHSETNYK